MPGATARINATPAVNAKLMITPRRFCFNTSGLSMIAFKANMSGMKFLPHDSRMEKRVAPSSAHFIGPFTIKHPNIKSAMTKAPT